MANERKAMLIAFAIEEVQVVPASPEVRQRQKLRSAGRTAGRLRKRASSILIEAIEEAARAGLSQREIAAAVGRSQPEVSRLLRASHRQDRGKSSFTPASPRGRVLAAHRDEVLRAAAARNLSNVRVFGSVASGRDTPESDIDLLVDVGEGVGLFSLGALEVELSDLLSASVDVVPSGGLKPRVREVVLDTAVRL